MTSTEARASSCQTVKGLVLHVENHQLSIHVNGAKAKVKLNEQACVLLYASDTSECINTTYCLQWRRYLP